MKYEEDFGMMLADASEYLDISVNKLLLIADDYPSHYENFEPTAEYYIGTGRDQLCRQVRYRSMNECGMSAYTNCLDMLSGSSNLRILDFGCGAAPIGFSLARLGHRLTFVDFDGASGFEFLKWRCKKYGIDNCDFIDARMFMGHKFKSNFDITIAMDSIEHVEDWEPLVDKLVDDLRLDGFIITNLFRISAETINAEHISMDRVSMAEKFFTRDMYPLNFDVWIKGPREPLLGAVKVSRKSVMEILKSAANNGSA